MLCVTTSVMSLVIVCFLKSNKQRLSVSVIVTDISEKFLKSDPLFTMGTLLTYSIS